MVEAAKDDEELEEQGSAALPRSPRDDMMEMLHARRQAAVKKEIESVEEPTEPPSGDPTVVQPSSEEVEEPHAEVGPSVEAAPQSDDELVLVRIDGQDEQVPKAEVEAAGGLRAYQKERAADKRLAEAAELKRQFDSLQAKLVQERAELEEQRRRAQEQVEANQRATAERAQEEVEDEAEAARIFDAIYAGNKEEGTKLLKSALGRKPKAAPAPAAGLTSEQISDVVSRQVRWENAIEKFQTDYSDVTGDPTLASMAWQNAQRLYQDRPTEDFYSVFSAAGQGVRNWVRKLKGEAASLPESSPGPSPTANGGAKGALLTADQVAARRAAKAQIDNPPAASVRQGPQAADRPKTPSEVIQDMRKQRGLG